MIIVDEDEDFIIQTIFESEKDSKEHKYLEASRYRKSKKYQ